LYGDGRVEQDPNYMIFNDRNCNYPQKTFGMWWLTQFRRWGMLKDTPNYQAIVDKVMRPDMYLEAMKELGVKPTFADMQPQKLFNGIFDPKQPEQYAKSFAIHSMA
jgi:nitrate/nitrite transport system substrate-binding protein